MKLSLILCSISLFVSAPPGAAQSVTYQGSAGPGRGKHVVMIAGDDGEYHSEEALPQLAKILAVRHGFATTVIFSVDAGGNIDTQQNKNTESGRLFFSIRTGSHPFQLRTIKTFEMWSSDSKVPGWEGGFGRHV